MIWYFGKCSGAMSIIVCIRDSGILLLKNGGWGSPHALLSNNRKIH